MLNNCSSTTAAAVLLIQLHMFHPIYIYIKHLYFADAVTEILVEMDRVCPVDEKCGFPSHLCDTIPEGDLNAKNVFMHLSMINEDESTTQGTTKVLQDIAKQVCIFSHCSFIFAPKQSIAYSNLLTPTHQLPFIIINNSCMYTYIPTIM